MSGEPKDPIYLGKIAISDLCHPTSLNSKIETRTSQTATNNALTIGLYVFHASWNCPSSLANQLEPFLRRLHKKSFRSDDITYVTGDVHVDESDEDLAMFCGDNGCQNSTVPCPPENLPVIALTFHRAAMAQPDIRYLASITPMSIMFHWRNPAHPISPLIVSELDRTMRYWNMGTSQITARNNDHDCSQGLRIFVAGDRMSVGKTSVCLGILGNLISKGYPPESLAYIKPATQNESPQSVQKYCERIGIACVPVGPIVYYRGFTRAFLAGTTEPSDVLLAKVEDEVDRLAQGKQVVVVDGVGFPAVGSICGTDNASVALASSYPIESPSSDTNEYRRSPLGVLLVGGSGVGGAVDAFNLNATYFEQQQIPVLGAIFNKLSLEGFYSLENCKTQISSYFHQNMYQQKLGRRPFGFVPLSPGMKIKHSNEMDSIDEFIKIFGKHVDIDSILEAASDVQKQRTKSKKLHDPEQKRPAKRTKVEQSSLKFVTTRTRAEIEQEAIKAGAAPSA